MNKHSFPQPGSFDQIVTTPFQSVKGTPFEELCRSFQSATGWPLRWVNDASTPGSRRDGLFGLDSQGTSVASRSTASSGRLEIDPSSTAAEPKVERHAANQLASAINRLAGELTQTRDALRSREAELATGVPVKIAPQEQCDLGRRFESILRAGCEAVGCQAGGLYLLDETTATLKLRAVHGLSIQRLLDPPRPLGSAPADLEALLGHAIVLENCLPSDAFSPPENASAAVCVPVSTSTSPLGTLWMYCDHPRPFTDAETNLIEIVAGRLACELERQMLLSESLSGVEAKRQIAQGAAWQEQRLPPPATRFEGYQLAGWAEQAKDVGGDFYDWFGLPGGRLTLAVGDALGPGVAAASLAAQLRGGLRAHAQYQNQSGRLLERLNRTVCEASPLDPSAAAMFCATLDLGTGLVGYASAGQVLALRLRGTGFQNLVHPGLPLGVDRKARYVQYQLTLDPGETLLVLTKGILQSPASRGLWSLATLAAAIETYAGGSAEEFVRFLRDLLESQRRHPATSDRALVVLQRDSELYCPPLW